MMAGPSGEAVGDAPLGARSGRRDVVENVVPRENGAQPRTRAMQARTNGAFCRREAVGDLLKTEIVVIVEGHDVAVIGGKLVERSADQRVSLVGCSAEVGTFVAVSVICCRQASEILEVEAFD